MRKILWKWRGDRHVALFLAIICAWSFVGFGADFEISVFGYPDEVLPGMLIEVNVGIRNVSGHPITLPYRRHLDDEMHDQQGNKIVRCPLLDFSYLIELEPNDWKGRQLPADWKRTRRLAYCFLTHGEYVSRFFISFQGPYRNRNEEEYQAWEGEVTTPSLKMVVLSPEGIDREVFDTFDVDSLILGEHWGDILRRFPTSTYAAHVIWDRWAKGTALPWEDDTAREKSLIYLENDSSNEFLTWKLPCRADGTLDASTITRFMMPEAARCRDLWLEIALKHHPGIWFADEIRLKLATDAYLLGDKEASASGLETLAEHARPYVAEKAQALLEAMQAKGMLPGGTKSPAAQEKETTASGSTAK